MATIHEFLWEESQREADEAEEVWATRNLKRRWSDDRAEALKEASTDDSA